MTLNNTLFYNWKEHIAGCSSNPTTKSYTTAASTATTNDKRQGSWNFYQAMGQPAVGKFVYHQGNCWEFMGTSTDYAPGGQITYLVVSPSPNLTADHNTCTECFSSGAAGQTYHTWSKCDGTMSQSVGLMTSGTLSTSSNNNCWTNMGSPTTGQITKDANGVCWKYEGTATNAGLGAFIMQTSDFVGATMYSAGECTLCINGPNLYRQYKLCGGTEVVNLVATGQVNSAVNNDSFYTSIGTPTVGGVVNVNTTVDSATSCWEYLGSSSIPEIGFQAITLNAHDTYTDCATCLNPPIYGCTDPTASNYSASATVDDGSCTYIAGCTDPAASNYNASATQDDGSCTYCIYGCTNPAASNYDSNATCDDGTCLFTIGSSKFCEITYIEECQPDGTSTITADLASATGLSNVTTSPATGITQSCTPPATISFTGVLQNQTVNITGECQYDEENWDPNNNNPSLTEPNWVFPSCDQVTVSSNTKVYCFYDGTSLGSPQAQAAYKAVMKWMIDLADFTPVTTHNDSGQNVYHIAVAGERWLDWGSSVLTGKFNNAQNPITYKLDGNDYTMSHCTAGSDCFVKQVSGVATPDPYGPPANSSKMIQICNWAYNTATTSFGSPSVSWTVDEFYDTAEGSLVNSPMVAHGTSSQNASQVYKGFPPAASSTDDVLVIIFADESTWAYHAGGQNDFTGNTSYSSSAGLWTDLQATQPNAPYKTDYTKFKTLYAAHQGTYQAFLYPSKPGNVSTGGGHKMFPLHALAAISSGNKSVKDGMWNTGTSPSNNYATIDLIETSNPYWTGNTPTWGGLDQFGWGVNVAGQTFTAATFTSDLNAFLASSTSCGGGQCVKIKVVDQNGVAEGGYPIKIDGVVIGSTDGAGEIVTTITSAGQVIINDCYTFTAVGNCTQSYITITLEKSSFTSQLNCILGCTDPNSWNYNPLAGVDDGSCMYPLEEDPRDSMSRCELLKIDTECNFATDMFNLYKSDRYGLDKGCLYNMDNHINRKYSTDWADNMLPDHGTEKYKKTLHTKDATPKPDWVLKACGEASEPLTLYFMYDCTSLSQPKVTLARTAVDEWVDEIVATRAMNATSGEACQESNSAGPITVYHTLITGERWVDWAIYPMTGKFNNLGQYDHATPTGDLRYCGGYDSLSGQNTASGQGFIDAVIPNNYPTSHFWGILQYDTPSRLWYNAGGTSYTCTNCTGHSSSTGYTGSYFSGTLNGEPPLPQTKNVLVVSFLDEAASGTAPAANYTSQLATDPAQWRYAMDGTNSNSAGNGVDTTSGLKCSTCYMNDYNKFIEEYMAWNSAITGRSINFYLYPSAPTSTSANGAHHVFPLHALGAIHSGDSTPKDGQLSSAPTNSITTLSDITTSNPYYTAQNTVTNHTGNGKLNSGYGGLDQYGWGTNVAEVEFTKAGFKSDLDTFWNSEVCNDSECIYIIVKDEDGKIVSNFDISIDGKHVGKTDEFGVLRTCISDASKNTDHKINLCYCFTTTGNCNSQKIEITVGGIEDCNECGKATVDCTTIT